ncbi:Acetone carboxylase beta subunit [Delftia tsuruhatensis]|uniref:hydantoinase/oxoprolinase family protein n=1 Tax=Delftia tsuruhatensis TaxID=180282 RepID=UPI001E7B8388|nr:hydantoinase/oxoprolinase family protein [Delftia tsuruhatensis]CAB5658725.1 Acetone carboxylase beta subunit [Delftia tsuruhatensis]CAC9679494.1 Acetone carboxylase beta subunit [Delftia tsuruhatensis]
MNLATQERRGVRVGCDIGGTFTDIVLAMPDGRLFVNKTSTTSDDLGRAIVQGLGALIEQAGIAAGDITEIVHGTTTASNTILQKVGANTGVLTTEGFRDVLEIGRIRTPTMFDLAWSKPEPLSPRRWRRGIRERIDARGRIVTALDEAHLLAQARELVDEGAQAMAVCFLNSYINPVHELAAKALLQAHFPDLLLSVSCEVLPEIKEYERTSTTVVNAYILPAMRSYLARLRQDLQRMGVTASLQVMASNGGMMGIASATDKPVFAVASGPAGGVAGAVQIGQLGGDQDLIVFDMGGTTAKASIIAGGQASLTNEYEFRDGISAPSRFVKGGGYVLKVPAIDIAEVGAGGGSIAGIDGGGLLCVGPESAGAVPGPACYGNGNERPTVTDANMVLGYLNPRALAGGSLPVRPELSQAAIERHVGAPLGLDALAAAHGIRQVANVNMARAIRAVTVERGRDPRDMSMIAFGGGGPLHAVSVARLLGIRRVIAPIMAGVFCSAGMLSADAEHHFVKAVLRPLADCLPEALQTMAAELGDRGLAVLASEGYGREDASTVLAADLRYLGQSSELTVPLASGDFGTAAMAALVRDFQALYHQTFGYRSDEPLELVNLRVSARGRSRHRLDFATCQVDGTALQGGEGMRAVSFEAGQPPQATRVMPRAALGREPVPGPLVIESYDTTIVVPPHCSVRADAVGNIIIDLEEQAP